MDSFIRSFESCRQENNEFEFWFAHDLQCILGYHTWHEFQEVIVKAKNACQNSRNDVDHHFVEMNEKTLLSRYVCYLIAQNGDPKKYEVALSQSYFSTKAAQSILSINDLTSIHSKGDAALFGGSTTQAMKARWNVPDKRPLADFAPTIILKAKDFAAEITIFNSQNNRLNTEQKISQEHITNNQAVRKTLLERGIRPETLPPAEDVKKVERRLASEQKKSLKNPETLDG